MRTTEIKIEGQKRKAVLVAGGQGFKIYTVLDFDGWVLSIGRKIELVNDNTPMAQTVADYVNIRYHSLNFHESITNKFNELLHSMKRTGENSVTEAPLN